MNKALTKDNTANELMITYAVLRVLTTKIQIWHVLNQDAFNTMISKFNHDHPPLNSLPGVKEKTINLELKLKWCISFKSEESYTKHFTTPIYNNMITCKWDQ